MRVNPEVNDLVYPFGNVSVQSNLLATGGGTADRCIKFWNTHTGALLR